MGDNEIDRIDQRTMSYSEKIPVGSIPRPYAVSADEKTLYVALSDTSTTRAPTSSWEKF